MTLLGKIFTFLIFLMSIVFMAFALLVFMTQDNWRQVVMRENAAAGEEIGLVYQLQNAKDATVQAEQERDELRRQLELERAARPLALAPLESQLQQALAENVELAAQNRQYEEELRAKVTEFMVLQENLTSLNAEVELLRQNIVTALDERNARYEEVVALTNQLNQAIGVRMRLEERRDQLIAQIDQYQRVMDYLGADPYMPIPPVPPAGLEGVVLAVNDQNLVEVSVGTDDGLREGHYLEVYRGTTYVGRLIIRRAAPDKAVGEFLPEFRQSPIRRGDSVAAQVS